MLVDLQHGAADMASVPARMLAIEHAGAEPLARVAANNPADIMQEAHRAERAIGEIRSDAGGSARFFAPQPERIIAIAD